MAEAFAYSDSPWPIRPDLAQAHRRAWQRIAQPGTWLDGEQRVAVAAEARAARSCGLCRERRAALSPSGVQGSHQAVSSSLHPALLDAVHRIATDPGRITASTVEKILAEGVSDAEYVEALGVTTQIVSIDAVHRALCLPLEPLPEPVAGTPTRRRPSGAVREGAFLPMVPPDRLDPENADLYGGHRTGNVIRALSLVPAEVRALRDLSAAHYLNEQQIARFDSPRALSRAQIELLAGRVSALNECFY